MTPLRHATESNVRQCLEQDLSIAFSRLRRLGGMVELEAELGAIGDNTPFADVHSYIRCQDALERLGRRSAGSQRSAFAIGEDALAGAPSHASLPSSYLPNKEDRDPREEPRVLAAPVTRSSEHLDF